jgi:O-antigen/teichoic acid export membrane protein
MCARRRFPAPDGRIAGMDILRSAAPFGLMALATLLYYRLGTLLIGALGSASATARYTVASTVAFGLLMVPNAITTGLLPRLSAGGAEYDQLRTARRALRWTVMACVLLSLVAASAAPYVLRYGFAPRYAAALVPLLVLLAGTVVIGVNGILGTVLIAHRHATVVAAQVGVSLAVNVALGVMLVPRFGAEGAAVATLVTELVALGLLAGATCRLVPGLLRPRALSDSGLRVAGRIQVNAEVTHEAPL